MILYGYLFTESRGEEDNDTLCCVYHRSSNQSDLDRREAEFRAEFNKNWKSNRTSPHIGKWLLNLHLLFTVTS